MYLSTAHSNGMIWYKPTLINKCISSINGKQKYFSFGILSFAFHGKCPMASTQDHTCSRDIPKHIPPLSARVHSIITKGQSRQLVCFL